jgi:hypothetical protein
LELASPHWASGSRIICVTCDASSVDDLTPFPPLRNAARGDERNDLMLLLLHGDEMNIIYFWSSILMVALPIAAFTWLTWLVIKRYRLETREKREGRGT